jgi:signal transduction histidine kinase
MGRGLLNMRERAHLLGADFDIRSESGKGIVIELKLGRSV